MFTSKNSDTWDNIYSITSFFSGESDDLTPYEYKNLLLLTYGKNLSETNLGDEVKLNKFVELSKKARQPLIGGTSEGQTGSVKVVDGESTLTSTQFRFMGQRYLLDSEAFYNLTKVDDKAYRPFPKGLDFPAVLGNSRALSILTKDYKEQEKFSDYPKKMEELKEKVKVIPESQWNSSNLYNAWIWTNKALLDEDKKYYPDTLKGEGWQDKSLNSFLGNWAEIRHDVILYAKQSEPKYGCLPPNETLGYVEPNVEFYERLDYTLSWLKSNLEKTKLLKESELAVIDYFINEVQFLRDISLKEIKGENISTDEMEHIKSYSNTLKTICLSIIDASKYSIPEIQDNGMAVIADVHNYNENCLEVGVGNPSKIYVIVPIQGKWYIAKGAVYSYYEFLQPTSSRLTDNEWKELLKGYNKPKLESWFGKYYETK